VDTQTTMNDNASEQTGYRAPAARKVFRILRTVAESRQEFSLSEISQKLGFSKSTVHGLVNALVSEGAPEHNPHSRKFSLNSTVVDLAFGQLELPTGQRDGPALFARTWRQDPGPGTSDRGSRHRQPDGEGREQRICRDVSDPDRLRAVEFPEDIAAMFSAAMS
jgi:hypothetical protein